MAEPRFNPNLRTKELVEIWNICQCGRLLHSINEGRRGTCSGCWMKELKTDTKSSLHRVIAAAFDGSDDQQKDQALNDAMEKLDNDPANSHEKQE